MDSFNPDVKNSFNPDVKNSFNPDDKQYRCCCCSFDVEDGAYAIGIIGIVLSALAFMQGIIMLEWVYVAGAILGFLRYGSIIYAQKKQNPSLYLPFLILNGIGIVLMGIYLLAFVVIFVFVPNELDLIDPQIESMQKNEKEILVMIFRSVTGMLIVVFAIAEIVDVWFQSVVYRAYKYMKMTHSSLNAQMQA
ncbi:hypothetical protein DdX_20892 [Ditylenchus destructor]|uniref:Uncharacterized protein n=1 Tax=Ditylenchus destructor TaxID=166010 RepID=A0AAD4MGI1_9BILA|nr:hypothetical protein DdX_20892 [Ditylenchus destructor]